MSEAQNEREREQEREVRADMCNIVNEDSEKEGQRQRK